MKTLLAPVSFCKKKQITSFASGTAGLAQNTYGSHIVLTLPIRLLGVDDPCLRSNLGTLVLIKTSGRTVVMATQHVSLCFFLL